MRRMMFDMPATLRSARAGSTTPLARPGGGAGSTTAWRRSGSAPREAGARGVQRGEPAQLGEAFPQGPVAALLQHHHADEEFEEGPGRVGPALGRPLAAGPDDPPARPVRGEVRLVHPMAGPAPVQVEPVALDQRMPLVVHGRRAEPEPDALPLLG